MTVTNLPASVHARLLNLARNAQRPYQELLQYFAMERFLYRLGQSTIANTSCSRGRCCSYSGMRASIVPRREGSRSRAILDQ